MDPPAAVIPVRVAVRIRPLSNRETEAGCVTALNVIKGRPQVSLKNSDKAFTYDFAYSEKTEQCAIYNEAVRPLIDQLFKGYNATVLAYGQTGSGKTFSMGTTNKEGETPAAAEGVIARAVRDIFARTGELAGEYDFAVRVAFVELYKEQLFDLLSTRGKKKEDCVVDLREDPTRGVIIANLTEVSVDGLAQTMLQLEQGSIKRVTAATAMNNVSSRSHAIFTVTVEGTPKSHANDSEDESSRHPANIVAKFHLVDLAGSERAKKTQATGVRYKEGVAINLGLLALGNVISALGDEGGAKMHIPYRDSKLTRLLQDSLGGNSHTLMIACVSPADSNLEETVSTLRYADRARKIKNKPIVNQNDKNAENAKLRREIAELKVQLMNSAGPGSQLAAADVGLLREKNAQLASENRELTGALVSCQDELAHMNEKLLLTEASGEKTKVKMAELAAEVEAVLTRTPLKSDVEEVLRKIRDVMDVQKCGEKSLAEHDLSRFNNDASKDGDNSCHGQGDVDGEDEFGARHALKQNALANQLADLNKMLAHKEQLAVAMTTNEDKLNEVRVKYEDQLATMESELAAMQREKDGLVNQHKTDPSSKIAEQRRKRIQELESSIVDLKKKVVEQQRVIKMNEKNASKVKQLGEEIRSMKAAKVKLIRQMKDDAERVRTWKAQKEREVIQLKQAERKQQAQMAKMATLHTKQQNVLRRKMEDAVAANKRLKVVLDKQKAAKKASAKAGGLAGAAERMRTLVEHELDVCVSVKEAKQSRENLLADRKTLTEQLAGLKKATRQTMTNDERAELNARMAELRNELDVRNAQIADLHAQILHVDSSTAADTSADDKLTGAAGGVKWWDSLQTMTDAKIALQFLFERSTEYMVKSSADASALTELRTLFDEAARNTKVLEDEIGQMKLEHSQEMVRAGKDYEERVHVLLARLSNPDKDAEIKDAELQKFSRLHEELLVMAKEMESVGPPPPPSKKPGRDERNDNDDERYTADEYFKEEFSDDDESDDGHSADILDPDWQQTPLMKRIRRIRESSLHPKASKNTLAVKRKLEPTDEGEEEGENDAPTTSASKENDEDGSQPKPKRSHSGSHCACKSSGCRNKRCPCRKTGRACTDACKCPLPNCSNRDNGDNASVLSDCTNNSVNNSTSCTMSLLNDTYNLPAAIDVDADNKLAVTPTNLNASATNISPPKKRPTIFGGLDGLGRPAKSPRSSERPPIFKSPIS